MCIISNDRTHIYPGSMSGMGPCDFRDNVRNLLRTFKSEEHVKIWEQALFPDVWYGQR
jgi:hypothetical protein